MRDTSDFEIPSSAQRLHQVIDLPRRDAVHVRFLHHRQQRVLGPPARLQQRREVRARPDLRDRQLDRAHARVPRPRPAAVAVRRPLAACARAARRRSGRRPPSPSAPARAPGCPPAAHRHPAPRGACQQTPTDPFWAWPSSSTPPCVLLPPERTHGKMRDGRSACLAQRPYRISTTSWDSNLALEAAMAHGKAVGETVAEISPRSHRRG